MLYLFTMEALITLQDKEIASGEVTTLAMQLEACMLADESAQARYLAIYGEPWVSLIDSQEAQARAIRSNHATVY